MFCSLFCTSSKHGLYAAGVLTALARLQSLSVADLEALLAYEEAGKARAPFQTLLANRITRATAK